ncbi:MAG: tol-pal system protein YbgF [Deltaproteobacteria bacterium HGW-Deltaproteobacteria-20]|nr:MAG: tol-pal system protein YbgF [Deltaproteobacteria bacterium HGW-Deltaproteobacteria-20]
MSIPRRLAVLTLLPAVCFGCSGAGASAQRQLDEMRREIHGIQNTNERLNERVTNLELAGAAATAPPKRKDERPDGLEVVKLGPGEEPALESEGAPPEDDGEPPTVIRVEGDRMPSVQRGSVAPKGATDAQAARDYDVALELLDKKRYEEALEALAGFLVRYPGHANADNAMYWRGECYYAMGNYVRAAEQFEGLLTRFPRGNKVPDALLKLGLSQRRMGEGDKAAKTFEQLRKNHPSSDAAGKIPRE